MPDKQLPYLFNKYINQQCSAAEREEFFRLLQREDNRSVMEDLINSVDPGTQMDVSAEKAEEIYKKILTVIDHQPARSIQLFNWRRIAVAASILIAVGLGSYFLFFNQTEKQHQVVTNENPPDIKAPETNRAMITLADGTVVYLDSVTNGTLASQSNVQLIKKADGQIIYDDVTLSPSKGQLVYNTLTNPRGSKVIDITLSDGSRVWLNAGSSVTYPVAFIGNERKVAVDGEAYFEVAHNATKPFYVTKGDMSVQVLGTQFNVNAYSNEEDIKVTLLEGSVAVTLSKFTQSGAEGSKDRSVGPSVKLKPGEQVSVINNSPLTINHSPDLEQVLAWKNGLTMFKGADIKSIMRQVERWYDVDVFYEGNIPSRTFSGGVSRDAKLSELLRILEVSKIHFRIEGRKLIVMP